MVCEESTKELKKKQEQLKSRTRWLWDMKRAIIKNARLCMFLMAGIFFLLVMVQSSFYMIVPSRYQEAVILLSRYGKWGLIAGVVVIYAVLKDSAVEGV